MMKTRRIQFSNPVRMLGLAVAIALMPISALADTTYLVSESGTFGAGAPVTAESAPNATFSYSFLIDATPVVNFVTAFGGPDCGFDAVFSNFTYTLNGSSVTLSGGDVEFFGTAFGGGANITPNTFGTVETENTPASAPYDNFFAYTAASTQFFTGTYEDPTMTPGIYTLDPTQSSFETDYLGTNDVPIGGTLSITANTPEPSSILLLGSGLAALGCLFRRKDSKDAHADPIL